jgi:hypothetical protein
VPVVEAPVGEGADLLDVGWVDLRVEDPPQPAKSTRLAASPIGGTARLSPITERTR